VSKAGIKRRAAAKNNLEVSVEVKNGSEKNCYIACGFGERHRRGGRGVRRV
jgi:hypothetical protein